MNTSEDPQRNALIGWSAAVVSVLIGVVWQLSTRAGASASLSPADLMLIRYGVPAIIMLPWLAKWGFWPVVDQLSPKLTSERLIVLIAFSGLVYGLFSYNGAKYAPVAHMGALVPGTMPIFVALLAWQQFGEKPNRSTVLALSVLLVGVALVSGGGQWGRLSSAVLFGDALFLIASLNWAIYMIALRGVPIAPIHMVALAAFWNAPFALALWLLTPETKLLSASFATLAWQIPVQGVIAAIGGNWVFLVVLQRLGAATAAGTGAAVPAAVAIGGVVFLAEPLNALVMLGVALTVLGIWAAHVWARR